jgi:hypothetical protein
MDGLGHQAVGAVGEEAIMTKPTIVMAICVASSLGIAAGQDAGLVTGRVIDNQTAAPVADVRVAIENSNGTILTSVTTNPDGTFVLRADDPKALLVIRSSAYAIYRRSLLTRENVELRLERPAVVAGVVIVGSGQGIRTRMTLISQHPRNLVTKSQTVNDGTFTFKGVLPGRAILIARAEGMAPTILPLEVQEGAQMEGLTVRLEEDGVIFGRIVDSSGAPVANADLTVSYPDAGEIGSYMANFVSGRKHTAADGRFWVRHLKPNTLISLRASQGSREAVSQLTFESGTQRVIELTLQER